MPTIEERKQLPDIDSVIENSETSARRIVRKGSGPFTKANTQNLVIGVGVGLIAIIAALILISHKNAPARRVSSSRHPQVDIGSSRAKPYACIAAPANKRPIDQGKIGSNEVTPQALQMTINPAAEQARKAKEIRAENQFGINPSSVSGAQGYAQQQAGKPSSAYQGGARGSQVYGPQSTATNDRPYYSTQTRTVRGNVVTQGQPLSRVPSFRQSVKDANGNWEPAPYAGGIPSPSPYVGPESTSAPLPIAMSQEEKRAFTEEVTKQSIIFTLTRGNKQGSGSDVGSDMPVTNLGLMEGYHIGARTETAASSAEPGMPVIADIQYNYMRDGRVLIPAGSRAVGKMTLTDASGYAGFSFNSLELPDGRVVPINAAALDLNMMPIKGIVTGKNLAKQFLVATMAGLGEATAMVAGGSNLNGAYSQSDMIKQQASMNIGNAADSQVQFLNSGQHIVVTVPAGTEINIVFVKPAPTVKSALR